MLPAVMLLRTGTPTPRQRYRAALVYGGPQAQLSGATGCELRNFASARPAGKVQLLIPASVRRQSTDFVVIERTIRAPDPCSIAGFPVAPAARCVLDHSRRLRDLDAIRALVAEAVQHKHCTVEELMTELDEGTIRRTALVRRALREISRGARSVAEARAIRIARRSGLPEPMWNVRLTDSSGCYVGTPDAWFDEVGLAWEIDSTEYHLNPEDHARTIRRDNRYGAHNVWLHRTRPSQLADEAGAISDLKRAYQAAARTPRPMLHVKAA